MRLVPLLVLVACSTPSRPPEPPRKPPVVVTPPAPAPADPHNLGFETLDGTTPKGWTSRSGELATDANDKHGGARALVLDGEQVALISLPAAPYHDKRVTLRGWIKTADSEGAALLLRADAGGDMVGFDNMYDRRVQGTAAWAEVSVKVDVPRSATALVLGAMQLGKGRAWFDDLAIEVTDIKPPEKIALEGVVVDPSGAPAAGAEVGLLSPEGEMPQHVKADERGRFKIEALAGKWGISAQRPGAVAAFIAQTRYDKSTSDLKIQLGKDGGVTVRGKLTRRPKPGTYLRVSAVSEFDADLFAVPVRDDGTFEVLMPKSDEYVVEVLDTFVRGNFKRTAADHVDVVLDMGATDPPPAEVVAYIAKHGIPLVSAEAGKGFDDMAPLGKLIGKAKIVALGESTHGSREIFQMKHRFLEYLVAKHGFTVFAIEANQPECRAINDYVLHGKGDAKTALAGIYFWTWNTEEVLEMIEWMRRWNADPAHTKKVQFTGFDMQTAVVAYKTVAAAVERAVPDKAAALLAPIARLGQPGGEASIGQATDAEKKALKDGLAALAPVLAKADADTRHDLRILEQATTMFLEKTPYDARDRAMAENVGWLLDQTKARIVVWAHNGHISNTLPSFTNMGSHLRKKYKQAYLNIGFVFGEGSFQAMDFTKPSRILSEHTLGPPPESHASVAFARTGKPLLVLDLRTLPKKGIVADWFNAPHAVRDTGAAFMGEKQMTYPMVLPKLFDAVIYIDKTTRARPVRK